MIRFLGSTKLTIALCLLLAAGGIAGSLLYQGNTAFGKIPTFNVFRSPFFLVPAALLVINVLSCAIPRLRGMPAGMPRTWTFAFLHLGLLLLGSALALDGLFGTAGTQYFPTCWRPTRTPKSSCSSRACRSSTTAPTIPRGASSRWWTNSTTATSSWCSRPPLRPTPSTGASDWRSNSSASAAGSPRCRRTITWPALHLG